MKKLIVCTILFFNITVSNTITNDKNRNVLAFFLTNPRVDFSFGEKCKTKSAIRDEHRAADKRKLLPFLSFFFYCRGVWNFPWEKVQWSVGRYKRNVCARAARLFSFFLEAKCRSERSGGGHVRSERMRIRVQRSALMPTLIPSIAVEPVFLSSLSDSVLNYSHVILSRDKKLTCKTRQRKLKNNSFHFIIYCR